MNDIRVQRMLRELHAGPPLRFFEDIFALRDIVAGVVAGMRKTQSLAEESEIAEPMLAGVAGGSSNR